jgi:lichenan operon transcriptional antiterminator
MIAIMHFRTSENHKLTEKGPYICRDQLAIHTVNDILDSLEKKLNCVFPPLERGDIYMYVSSSRFQPPGIINSETITDFFEPNTIKASQSFIADISEIFNIDISGNEEFYIVILGYFRYLSLPFHRLNESQINIDKARSKFTIEFEIAMLGQRSAIKYLGRYLNQTELYYLAMCISGIISHINQLAPQIKTIVVSQYNMPILYNLKHKLLNAFNDYLNIIDLLAVYREHDYDFSETELIIITANKQIADDPSCRTIFVSPFFTSGDEAKLKAYINEKQIMRLFNSNLPSLEELLNGALWHECIDINDSRGLLEYLAADFIGRKYVSPDYLEDIRQRENIISFSFGPSLVFIYSLVRSNKSCLSIAVLNHRIVWNGYKVRTAIMAAVRPADATLIFRLIHELYYSGINLYDARHLKTKEEILRLFKNCN